MGGSLLKDIKAEFQQAVNRGQEIEFSYNGKHYFESRNSDNDWYIYCIESKEKQDFISSDELLLNATFEGENVNHIWENIVISCIL